MKFGINSILIALIISLSVALNVCPALANVSALETSIDSDRSYWFNAFSLASVESSSTQDGGAMISSYNYLSINTSTSYGTHWALRLPFLYNTAGFNDFDGDEVQPQGVNGADVLIDYTVSSTLLPGDIEVFSRYRIEIPTSKYSWVQRKIVGLRFDAIASRYINKDFQLEYWPIITHNAHSLTVYTNPDTGGDTHTKSWELDQRLSLWYKADPKLFIGAYIGTEDDWFNKSNVNNTTRARDKRYGEHSVKVGPSVRYTLNRNFSFLFNVQNVVPIWGFSQARAGSISNVGQFKPEHTEFVLLSFINF